MIFAACPNCSEISSGDYCPNCEQSKREKRPGLALQIYTWLVVFLAGFVAGQFL